MQLMRDETFGPVVGVMTVKDADEVVEYELNSSVWTRDIERGIPCVNECVVTAGLPELPFGGVKQSGVGTRHGGAEGVRQFCVRQALLIERAGGRRRWRGFRTLRVERGGSSACWA